MVDEAEVTKCCASRASPHPSTASPNLSRLDYVFMAIAVNRPPDATPSVAYNVDPSLSKELTASGRYETTTGQLQGGILKAKTHPLAPIEGAGPPKTKAAWLLGLTCRGQRAATA